MKINEDIVINLISAYKNIMQTKGDTPEWAVHKRNFQDKLVKCTIPFVGKEYSYQPQKILVYASAENLAGYYPGNDKEWVGDWLDDDEQAINRHRKCFENKVLQDDPFFPHVHLQPMNNGCLATATYYIANKLFNVDEKLPQDFYETIAFGNYGKYSIETEFQRSKRVGELNGEKKANIDYAGNKELLEESHDYILADIKTLNPDYIIIPSSIYNEDKKFIDSIKGNSIIIPICQMNTGVINRSLTRRFKKYNENELSSTVKLWYNSLQKDGMTGKSKENYLSVFTYLDDVLAKL